MEFCIGLMYNYKKYLRSIIMKSKFIILIAAIFVFSLSGCANYDINFNKVDSMSTQG